MTENTTQTDKHRRILEREVQQRQEIEQALKQSEAQLSSIFESSVFGIMVLSLDGTILECNQTMQRLVGYTGAEIVGHRFSKFTHPADLLPAERFFQDFIARNNTRYRLEKRYRRIDREIVWTHLFFTGVFDDQGQLQFVMSLVEDITERKNIEIELAEMKARLLDSVELERLQLSQELHDGPLQDLLSVTFQIEALRPQLNQSQADILVNMADTLKQVLTTLRAAAKELRPPAITDFGLAKAMRSLKDDLNERHPDLEIQLYLAEDYGLLSERVCLALYRIYQQALMNVVRHAQATRVTVRYFLDAEEIALEIQDNGIGFEVPARWIRLVREGHFGLAGAAERVEILGGHFSVRSQPGQGTCLKVTLPRDIEEQV